MEIVKVQLARAIWLFDVQELNPRGVSVVPDISAGFAERYQFGVLPKPEEIQSGGSVYFKQGKFSYELTTIEIELELHSDGMVANSRHSTEASSAFLHDCVTWLGEQLGVTYHPSLTNKRMYRSELIVSMTPKFESFAPKLQEFTTFLSGMTKQEVRPTGIDFGSEDRSGLLQIERRINAPFEANRYFSAAALQTSQHVEALKLFEKVLS